MVHYKYLSREHLEGFDNYKYMAIDTSPLSVYVMHPFWNRVVELVPKWVAPNVLTFGGFLLVVLNFSMLSYYDYNYYAASYPSPNATLTEVPSNGHLEVIPQNLWFVIAVFLFAAYTLDGIDGKQARRTQTSGPLGELFDHGLDSYTVFFIPACLYSIFGRLDFSIPPIRIYYVMWNLLLNFYLSHWEKYNTGVLFLPWGYDFSMWASTLCFIWTGANGTLFYKKYVFGSYTVANVFEWSIYATGVVTNLPVALYNIHKSYKLGTGKMRSFSEAIKPLWSLLSVFIVCTLWVHQSTNLPDYDLRALFLLIGTLFSNVACRLIVSQMSNQRCELVNWLLWPLVGAATLSLAYPQYELVAFYGITLLVVLAHVHYGTCVFDAEFRRFSLSRLEKMKYEDFKALIEKLHRLHDVAFLISYTDPRDGDLLPINNDDNLARALLTARPLLRVIIQRKGDSLEELNGYGTMRPRNIISSILSGTPAKNKGLAISNPHDFRMVSAIIDVDIVPETCRRVKLLKHGSDRPLGFFIRDGTSVRVTPNGVERSPGIFISRLVPGGLAESTGLLGVNDEVLEVNGIDVSNKTLDQVTDMMVANSSNLIITVRPANQRSGPPPPPETVSRNSHPSTEPDEDRFDQDEQDEIVDLTAVTLEDQTEPPTAFPHVPSKDDGQVLHL